jgi:hypothetical protein
MPFIESGSACGKITLRSGLFAVFVSESLLWMCFASGLAELISTYRADDKGVIADGGRDGLSRYREEGMSCDQMRTCCIE